jgi:hypothetical protein
MVMYNNRIARLCALISAAIALTGCAATDKFADRAAHYNLQLEQSQDQAILLNVVRAAERRPFMFTQLTVSASATPSGALALALPFGPGATTPNTVSPTLSLSGGPTLTVTPLDTQEFYQGILKPIPASTVDLLVQRGISKELLFNLLFSRIVIHRLNAAGDDAEPPITANNYVDKPEQLAGYQRLVRALLRQGLTTTSDKADAASYGPPRTASDLGGVESISRATAAGLQVKAFGWCDLSADDRDGLSNEPAYALPAAEADALNTKCDTLHKLAQQADSLANEADQKATKALVKSAKQEITGELKTDHVPLVFYKLIKPDSSQSFRLCFSPTKQPDTDDLSRLVNTYCSKAKPDPTGAHANEAVLSALSVSEAYNPLCIAIKVLENGDDPALRDPKDRAATYDRYRQACGANWSAHDLRFDFVPRSTYGVVYYLGEVVRPQLTSTDGGSGRVVGVGCEDHSPTAADGANHADSCWPIFVVGKSLRPPRDGSFVSARYDGAVYSLHEGGFTYEVLDIVNELLSLNKSAKDLPTSNILTVIGAP